MSCGIFLIDSGARVVSANAAAEKLLNAGLRLIDGRLTSDDPIGRNSLSEAIARAFGRTGSGKQVPILLPRRSGKTALVAQMSPLVGIRNPGALPVEPERPLGVLFVLDPSEQLEIDANVVANWFGLSPSEGRVAAEIARGRSPRDAAEVLGLTEASARVILKRVFAKAHVSRQAELAVAVARCHGLVME